jgi:hypothetical protein
MKNEECKGQEEEIGDWKLEAGGAAEEDEWIRR